MVSPVFKQWNFVLGSQPYRLECVRFADRDFRQWQFKLLVVKEKSQVVAVFDEKKVLVQLHPNHVKLTSLASLLVRTQDRVINGMHFSGGQWRASIELKEDEGVKSVVTLMIVNY